MAISFLQERIHLPLSYNIKLFFFGLVGWYWVVCQEVGLIMRAIGQNPSEAELQVDVLYTVNTVCMYRV